MIRLRKNIGTPGRLIRLTLALILLALAYWQQSWILLAFGIFTLFEATMSWCIFYQLIGKSSCPLNKK